MTAQTYRQLFGRFRRSESGKMAKSILFKNQLGLCCGCKKAVSIGNLEIHHLVPVKELEKNLDIANLTNINNLVLLCRSCNASQGCKIDNRFT